MNDWKPKKGDTVFYINDKASYSGESTVVSVGKAWITLTNKMKFDSELLCCETGGYSIYPSQYVWQCEQERQRLYQQILKRLETFACRKNTSMDQLLRIEQILNENATED